MINQEEAEATMEYLDKLFAEELPPEKVHPIKTRYKIRVGKDQYPVAVLKKGEMFHFGVVVEDEFMESKTTKPVSSMDKISKVLDKLFRKGKIVK